MTGDPHNPCGRAFYDAHGRQLAVGEMPRSRADAGVYKGPMPSPSKDVRLKRPKRPCSRCGTAFQPTVRRRLLCGTCFGWASSNDSPLEPEAEPDGGPL